ncbi:MAG: YqaA family protein [Pusillimonas sp.]
METSITYLLDSVFRAFALPQTGLAAVFLVSLVSSTLLPMGSEAVLLAYIGTVPAMAWAALAVATLGNTLGGVITFWMGRGAEALYERYATPGKPDRLTKKARQWVERWGAPVLLLSWLPVIGDPLCAVAGWMRLPFWRSVVFIAIGKALRYLAIALPVLWFFPAN